MSHYPPPNPYAAEEYELPSYNNHHQPQNSTSPGPSSGYGPGQSSTSPRPSPLRQRSSLPRTLTIQPSQSTSHLLFAAPPTITSPHTHTRHVRSASLAQSDGAGGGIGGIQKRFSRAQFLNEDLDHLGAPGYHNHNQSEEVELPDFGQMLGFNPETGEDHYAIAQRMSSRWKRRLYMLMEEPNSGREAFFVHVLVTGAIIFSAVLTTFSTLPSFHTNPSSIRTLFGLDTTIVVLFTVEYIVRSLAHSDTWIQYYNWSTSFFGLLDLISILPYYIEVARNEDTSILFRFSILRTFRLLRVFRAFKYQNQMLLTIEVMYVAVYRSKDALLALSFFLLLVLVFFSTLIYFAERGTWDATIGGFVDADGDPSAFDSIPQTAWFSLVTMSTVGYGEVVPKSFLGKLLTVPLLMFGLLLIALPSFVLGRNFAIVFDAMTSQLNRVGSEIESPRTSFSQPPSPRLPTTTTSTTTTGGPDPAVSSLQQSSHTPLMTTTSHSHSPIPGPSILNSTNTNSTPFMAAPLYPQNPNLNPNPRRGLGVSPNPDTGGRIMPVQSSVRMWDGGPGPGDGLESKAPGAGVGVGKERDLTNVKLAKNQLVLLEQIDSLRQTIDQQGEMLNRLMSALNVNVNVTKPVDVPFFESYPTGTVDSRSNNGVPPITPLRVKGKSRQMDSGLETPAATHDAEEDQFALGDSDGESFHTDRGG